MLQEFLIYYLGRDIFHTLPLLLLITVFAVALAYLSYKTYR